MVIAAQLLTSFVAAAGFSVLFNAPRQVLIQCGLIGMLGWISYYMLVLQKIDALPATVLAAILVGLLSQLCAQIFKKPIIIFYVAGIIPLVPGGLAYNAMREFVGNNYIGGVELSAKVMLISGGISLGLMFSEVVNMVYQKATGKFGK